MIFFSPALFWSLLKVFKVSSERSFPHPAGFVSPLRSPGVRGRWEQTCSFRSKSFQALQNAAADDGEGEARAYFSHADTAEAPQILLDWRDCTSFLPQLCSSAVSLHFPQQRLFVRWEEQNVCITAPKYSISSVQNLSGHFLLVYF